MESINQALFLWLNASSNQPAAVYFSALFLGQYWNIAVAAVLCGAVLRSKQYANGLRMLATCAVALLAAYAIGHFYYHPRPFVIGLGHNWITHSASASFPSKHLTFYWSLTMAMCFLPQKAWKKWGLGLTLFGWAEAWSRVYLGVHYPFDMAGSWCVAWVAAWTVANLYPHMPARVRKLSVKRS